MCEYNPKISVALEITADLPSSEELQRWLGEPVRVRSSWIFLQPSLPVFLVTS